LPFKFLTFSPRKKNIENIWYIHKKELSLYKQKIKMGMYISVDIQTAYYYVIEFIKWYFKNKN